MTKEFQVSRQQLDENTYENIGSPVIWNVILDNNIDENYEILDETFSVNTFYKYLVVLV